MIEEKISNTECRKRVMNSYYLMGAILLVFSIYVIIFLDVLIGLLSVALSLGATFLKLRQTDKQLPQSLTFNRNIVILNYRQRKINIQFGSVIRVRRLENVMTKKDTCLVLETEDGKIHLTVDHRIADEFMRRYENFKKSEVKVQTDKLILTKAEDTDVRKRFGFFLGAMSILFIFMVLYEAPRNTKSLNNTLVALLSLIGISIFSFSQGISLHIESLNSGEKAIDRFWRQYKKGKLPELYAVELTKYKGITYTVLSFRGNIWHANIYVYIPVKTAIETLLLENKSNGPIKAPVNGIIHEMDNNTIELSEDENDAFMFLSYLSKTQGKRLEDSIKLLKSFEQEEI